MQTNRGSVIEVLVTTTVGYLVSVTVGQLWLYPIYGIELELTDNLGLTSVFIGISMFLKYGFRRLFNSLNWFTEESDDERFARLEHEHLGCPVAKTGIYYPYDDDDEDQIL